ncbi:MAG: hypothetical protein ACOCUY_02410 [Verrucomicrobiota bacterium]
MHTENGQPVLIELDQNGNASRTDTVARLDLQSGYDEDWLQCLLFREPGLLSVGFLDQRVQKELVPLAMEVGLPSGICDSLYVSRDGYVVVVETKLWRNSQSRREAVAQILDYGTQIRRWDYSMLESVWREYNPGREASLWEYVEPAEGESEWIDLVSRNLSAGRMTLVVAGDGIREEAWDLADSVNGHPDFEFRLGMVEIRLYKGASGNIIAVPYIQTRTQEVTRAIVRIEGEQRLPEGMRIQVDTSVDKVGGAAPGAKRTPKPEDLSMEEFWDYVKSVAGSCAEDIRSCVDRLLADLAGDEFVMRIKGRSPIFVAQIGDAEVQLGRLYNNGHFVCYVTKGTVRDITKDQDEVERLMLQSEELRGELGINEGAGFDVGVQLSSDNYCKVLNWLRRSKAILEDAVNKSNIGTNDSV